MVTPPPFGSVSFRLVVRGLVALHRLIKEGKDDSPDAERIRDAPDAPLKALNATEKNRAQWLSDDLYSISEPDAGTKHRAMDPQFQQQLNEALEARQSRDWDRSLAILRRLKDYKLPALLSYLRGSIWLDAGYPEIAVEFYRHCAEGDPSNANYLALYIHALAESDPDMARKLARDVLADDEKFDPTVVARAAEVCFNEARTASDSEAIKLYAELMPILERNTARIENNQAPVSCGPAYAIMAGLLGFCYEFLGNDERAVHYYSRGLQIDPNNDGLLIARGILLYGDSVRATADFEQAVNLGSPIIWPYLFLAHHYLITARFDECRIICETGLRKRGSDTARSQLEEWRAIAQAELGFPPDLVRAAFEAAIRFDPSNEWAKRNQAAFETSSVAAGVRHRAMWAQRPEAAVRQLGLAERRYSLAA